MEKNLNSRQKQFLIFVSLGVLALAAVLFMNYFFQEKPVSQGGEAGSIEKIMAAAEQGDAQAQYSLGDRYYWGRGVAQDKAEAVKWFRLAAEKGEAIAQYGLGEMYYFGWVVAQDHAEADKWFRLAAEKFRLAAEKGEAKAQYRLGDMYYRGQGVAQDYVESAKWIHLAAEQGLASAQFLLGIMYNNGEGVAQDYAEAAIRNQHCLESKNPLKAIFHHFGEALLPLMGSCETKANWSIIFYQVALGA